MARKKEKYIFFNAERHTADLQLVVYGDTKQELFSHAIVAMFQSVKPTAQGCTYGANGLFVCPRLPVEREVIVTAPDIELLLVDFLSEALYFSDIYNEVYIAVTIKKLEDTLVEAVLRGIVIDKFEYEIKAVTYHNLAIVYHNNQWRATVVFDI